jgi:hypothetical protein
MLMLAAMAVMVSLFAVVAYAAEIQGTDNDETLVESERNDTIAGHRGEDTIDAGFYGIDATPGDDGDVDLVKGNRGEDTLDAVDGDGDDKINGGRGFDECTADTALGDEVVHCE